MQYFWKSCCLLLIICYCLGSSVSRCNLKDNCQCYDVFPFEIQCPKNFTPNDAGFVIKIEEKKIRIDCYKMKTFRFDLLPNITLKDMDSIYLSSCPLPKTFKTILDHFSSSQIQVLRFDSAVNISLTKRHFEGLLNLKHLKFNALSIDNIDEDFLDNTPELVTFDFENSKNFRLNQFFFNKTSLLKRLSLPRNHFQDLPRYVFKNLNRLTVLWLWSNNLTEITKDTFYGLTSLATLELTKNFIQTINEDSFENLTQLTGLNLQQNNLTLLSSNLFRNNKRLKFVSLAYNLNIKLSDYLFADLLLLETVDLSFNNLRSLPEHIFQNSSNLKILKLNRNNITCLQRSVFKRLQNLKNLHLENNFIQVIEKDVFKDLINLEKINLGSNKIKTIHLDAFFNKNILKNVILSHNQLKKIPIFLFLHVEYADFSYNNITEMTNLNALRNIQKLKKLDLSHNSIIEITVENLRAFPNMQLNLNYNNITKVNLGDLGNIEGDTITSISLYHNSIKCDCGIYDFLQFLKGEKYEKAKEMITISTKNLTCASPPELNQLEIKSLLFQNISCLRQKISNDNKRNPERCSYRWRPYDRSVVIDCSYRNLKSFPKIHLAEMLAFDFNQTEMNLEGNDLTEGIDSSLTDYDNITRLFLSYNKIETISWLPPKLKVLKLDNNRIKHLNYAILHLLQLTSLEYLSLDNNLWSCDCSTQNLTKFLRQNTEMVNARTLYCFNSTKLLIDLYLSELCYEFPTTFLILIILSFFFIIAFVSAIYYRHQQEIKIWLYAHNMCLFWVTEDELDKNKIYDAFISYSHKDEDFVTGNLLPVLEGGPQPYKLCLHYRNWIPGEFITTQVTNSVLESCRTLVVLSPNFLESVWGKMEFRTAHTQAMTEGRARVIIVLYGDVDVDNLDDELKTYLKTNTYVKWGDPYFWNKLKYALPHSKRGLENNQKIANVMNCIDDKFKFVAPVTKSQDSTMPALALFPTMLKKHPLNFISSPSQGIDTPPAESGALFVSSGL